MRSFRTAFLVVVFASVASIFPLLSFADGDNGDHDRARQALLDGKVLSLRDVLDKVSRDFPGEPVEIEFEEADPYGSPSKSSAILDKGDLNQF